MNIFGKGISKIDKKYFLWIIIFLNFLYIGIIIFGRNSFHRELLIPLSVLSLTSTVISATIFNMFLKKSSIKLAFTSILIIPIVLVTFYYGSEMYFSNFSTNKWSNYKGLRYLMEDDLNNKYDFENLKKNEIIEILGEDDSGNKIGKYMEFEKNKNYLIYGIANESSFRHIYFRYLIINFDNNDMFLNFNGADYQTN